MRDAAKKQHISIAWQAHFLSIEKYATAVTMNNWLFVPTIGSAVVCIWNVRISVAGPDYRAPQILHIWFCFYIMRKRLWTVLQEKLGPHRTYIKKILNLFSCIMDHQIRLVTSASICPLKYTSLPVSSIVGHGWWFRCLSSSCFSCWGQNQRLIVTN